MSWKSLGWPLPGSRLTSTDFAMLITRCGVTALFAALGCGAIIAVDRSSPHQPRSAEKEPQKPLPESTDAIARRLMN